MVLFNAALFVLGLILLVKGSGFLVESVSRIAKRLGVSDFVIGLTLVAVGTSLPELVSSITAVFKGQSDFIMGNIVGSNIANISLIIGLTAVIFTLKVRKKMFDRDGLILIFVSGLFYFFILNNFISRLEGLILLLLFLAYILFLFSFVDTKYVSYGFVDFMRYFLRFRYLVTIKDLALSGFRKTQESNEEMRSSFIKGLFKDTLIFSLSLIAIIVGANYLVDSTVYIAEYFKLPLSLISLSAVAVGTSLPELSVSIAATKKGFYDIVFGNIVGSNIANILLVIGITSLINPISVSKTYIIFFTPVMLFFTITLLSFMHKDRTLTKLEGFGLLIFYFVFIAAAFYLGNIKF